MLHFKKVGFSGLGCAALILGVATIFETARAEDTKPPHNHYNTITVSTSASESTEADEVTVNLSLVSTAKEASEAEKKLSKLFTQLNVVLASEDDMKKKLDKLDPEERGASKTTKIPFSNMATAEVVRKGLNLGMRPASTNWRGAVVPAGFYNTCNVSLVFRQIESMPMFITQLARTLDRLNESEIVSTSDPTTNLSVRYSYSKLEQLRKLAYASAFNDASERAQSLAKLSKLQLGSVASIREDKEVVSQPVQPVKPTDTALDSNSNIEVKVALTVEFELVR